MENEFLKWNPSTKDGWMVTLIRQLKGHLPKQSFYLMLNPFYNLLANSGHLVYFWKTLMTMALSSKMVSFAVRWLLVQFLALPLTNCLILGKLAILESFILYKCVKTNPYFIELLWGINVIRLIQPGHRVLNMAFCTTASVENSSLHWAIICLFLIPSLVLLGPQKTRLILQLSFKH